jgi:nucleoid-associated protein YgaU
MNKFIATGGATIDKKAEKTIEEAAPVKEEQKTAATVQKQKPPELLESNVEFYTVQVKDDLVSISEKLLNDYSKWKDLYEANRDIIKNPYVIYPGQKLKIPAKDRKK